MPEGLRDRLRQQGLRERLRAQSDASSIGDDSRSVIVSDNPSFPAPLPVPQLVIDQRQRVADFMRMSRYLDADQRERDLLAGGAPNYRNQIQYQNIPENVRANLGPRIGADPTGVRAADNIAAVDTRADLHARNPGLIGGQRAILKFFGGQVEPGPNDALPGELASERMLVRTYTPWAKNIGAPLFALEKLVGIPVPDDLVNIAHDAQAYNAAHPPQSTGEAAFGLASDTLGELASVPNRAAVPGLAAGAAERLAPKFVPRLFASLPAFTAAQQLPDVVSGRVSPSEAAGHAVTSPVSLGVDVLRSPERIGRAAGDIAFKGPSVENIEALNQGIQPLAILGGLKLLERGREKKNAPDRPGDDYFNRLKVAKNDHLSAVREQLSTESDASPQGFLQTVDNYKFKIKTARSDAEAQRLATELDAYLRKNLRPQDRSEPNEGQGQRQNEQLDQRQEAEAQHAREQPRGPEPVGQGEEGRQEGQVNQLPAKGGEAAQGVSSAPSAGKFYRETNIERLSELLPGSNTHVSNPFGAVEYDVATHPDLALGQGKNTGVFLEFSGDVNTRPGRPKPAAGFVRAFGGGEERLTTDPPEVLRQKLQSVTIRRNAEGPSSRRKQVQNLLNSLVKNEGWTVSNNGDGSVTYRRPAPPPAQPPSTPTQVAAQTPSPGQQPAQAPPVTSPPSPPQPPGGAPPIPPASPSPPASSPTPSKPIAPFKKGLSFPGVSGYAESLINRVERQGGAPGRFAAKLARNAVKVANEVSGSVANKKLDYERKLRGSPLASLISGKTREYNKARSSLAEPEFDGSSGFSRMQLLVEGGPIQTQPKSAAEQEVVDGYNDVVQSVFREAQSRGVKLTDRKGGVIDIDPEAEVFKFRRSPTAELYDMHRRRDANFQLLKNELARLNNLKPKQVQEALDEMLGPDSIRNTGIEVTRAFKVFPTHLRSQGGEPIKLLESDPIKALDAAIRNDADRIGFVSQFGQEVKGQAIGEQVPFADRLRGRFVRNEGNETDFNRLVAALNNRPLAESGLATDLVSPRGEKPGSIRDVARRIAHGTDKALETTLLSLSSIPNAVEQIAKIPSFGGSRRWLRSIFDLATSPKARRNELRQIGAITTALVDFKVEPGRRFEDFARIGSQVGRKAILHDPINELNESVAANTGRIMAADLKAGRKSPLDGERLRVMEFNEREVKALLDGTAPESLYNEIPRRLAEKTQGSTSRKAQKSAAANSRLFNKVFRFQNYAQLTMRTNARVVENFVDAVRSGEPGRIAKAGAVAAQYIAGSTLSGAGQIYLVSLLTGRDTDRSDESWPQWIGKNLVVTTIGGPLYTIAAGLGDQQSVGDIAINTSPHLRVLGRAIELIRGDGRFAEMTPSERAVEFLKGVTPLTRVQKGYLTMIGLHDPVIETANAKYWNWRISKEGKPANRASDDRFHLHMRNAYNALRNGRIDEANGEISLAVHVPGHDEGDARASILTRRKLSPLSSEELADLKQTIGEKHFNALQREEDLINNFAWMNPEASEFYRNVTSLRRRERENTISDEDAAILKRYERANRRLTALRKLHDEAKTEQERKDLNQSIEQTMAAINEALRSQATTEQDKKPTGLRDRLRKLEAEQKQ